MTPTTTVCPVCYDHVEPGKLRAHHATKACRIAARVAARLERLHARGHAVLPTDAQMRPVGDLACRALGAAVGVDDGWVYSDPLVVACVWATARRLRAWDGAWWPQGVHTLDVTAARDFVLEHGLRRDVVALELRARGAGGDLIRSLWPEAPPRHSELPSLDPIRRVGEVTCPDCGAALHPNGLGAHRRGRLCATRERVVRLAARGYVPVHGRLATAALPHAAPDVLVAVADVSCGPYMAPAHYVSALMDCHRWAGPVDIAKVESVMRALADAGVADAAQGAEALTPGSGAAVVRGVGCRTA